MRHRIALPTLPATFLIIRIGRVVLPIPWILLWTIALVLMPFCWVIGFGARGSAHRSQLLILRRWHLVVLLLVAMRGMTISVRRGQQRVYLKWF